MHTNFPTLTGLQDTKSAVAVAFHYISFNYKETGFTAQSQAWQVKSATKKHFFPKVQQVFNKFLLIQLK